MKFAEIPNLEEFLVGEPVGIKFSGVQCDSRRVQPGDLFVAVAGVREHGAQYAISALERGAAAVVAEEPVAGAARQTVLVRDARRALACIAAATQGAPSQGLRVYGITGTNGKTTTTLLLNRLLKAGGLATGMLTTVAIEYAGRSIPATHTTPDACELQATFAAMRSAGCQYVTMEVSSHGIEQQRIAYTHFSGAGFTNLTRDHLDYHGDMESYLRTKLRLFKQLAAGQPGAVVACCSDAPGGAAVVKAVTQLPLKLVKCGFAPQCDLRAEDVKLMADGSAFTLALPDGQHFALRTHLSGRYNIANMLVATALALDAGVAPQKVAQELELVRPQWGRLERVVTKAPAAVFVDYAHTDDALRNVLTTLREFTNGRLIVVFGCGGNRDRTKRPLMGLAGEELADYMIVTSDNPRYEEPLDIIGEILSGVSPVARVLVEADRRKAIEAALREAGPQDVVLIAGKGHEAFQEVYGRSMSFDDRKVAQEEAARLYHAD